MKNFFKFFTITLLAVTVSCSSDDDASSGGADASVVGTFRMVSFESESSFDLDGDGDSSRDLLEETGCYQNETITFANNNTGVALSTSYADIYVDVEVVNGEETTTQIVQCIEEDDTSNFTWAQANNTITITVDGEAIVATFTNDNQIVFVIPSGFIGELEDGAEGSVFLTEDVTVTYERI